MSAVTSTSPTKRSYTKRVKEERRGRRHLDGSAPGKGEYLSVVTVSLRPQDKELLEIIGEGNRSVAVRRLLEMFADSSSN